MKRFNTTGVCVPHKHYMVDINNKLNQIIPMIERGDYFTINKARQYGKTTIRYAIESKLKDKYTIINTSFEGLGETIYKTEENFSSEIFDIFAMSVEFKNEKLAKELREIGTELKTLKDVSKAITKFCKNNNKEVILIIDEVDKSCNNQLFLHFLGMLRDKFLNRETGNDITFKSVILLGVHDVKNLKLKLRPNEEKRFNSPWNIATNFEVDMSFSPDEISTMIIDYEKENNKGINIQEISEQMYDYTSGYPFLVSRLCQIIEEKLDKKWTKKDLNDAFNILIEEHNTLFDDLIKNLENDKKLYSIIFDVLINGRQIPYNTSNPDLNKAAMYAIIKADEKNKVKIHNKIFETYIYNYMISKKLTSDSIELNYASRNIFIKDNNELDIELVLKKFQELMYQEYRKETEKFIEKEGRLIFLSFIKPIINGTGHYFVEEETRDSSRMDIIINYNSKQYIVELKIWYGQKYEETGLEQLANYLEIMKEDKGYLIIFNFNKNKQYTKEWIQIHNKQIYKTIV